MNKNVEKNKSFSGPVLEPDELKIFFISHLNRIYCAKSHLHERLPDIIDHADFRDLKFAITETFENVKRQIARMDKIFNMLPAEFSFESCEGLIGLVEEAFNAIHQHSKNPKLRDLTILFYMFNIESIETASFRVLLVAVQGLKNNRIKQLLQENYDEAREDSELMLHIAKKYLKG